jgi:hypothetical protein
LVSDKARNKLVSDKIGLRMARETIFRLKLHAFHIRRVTSDVVEELILEHIPEYELVEDDRVLVPANPRASAAGTQSNGAKSRGSKRDGKEQADRTRGRARG